VEERERVLLAGSKLSGKLHEKLPTGPESRIETPLVDFSRGKQHEASQPRIAWNC
jgi:hypothetical protein